METNKTITASEMGKRGRAARMRLMTPEERSAVAKQGAEAARRKRLGLPPEPPAQHWCLFLADANGDLRLEFSSPNRQKVREYARAHPGGFITSVDYKPLLKVTREFGSDTTKELAALERTLSK